MVNYFKSIFLVDMLRIKKYGRVGVWVNCIVFHK